MKLERYVYRYTNNGEGVWSAGKRLLPKDLVNEVLLAKKWLPKPNLPKGEYRFYMKKLGKDLYEKTLKKSHQKYLQDIKLEKVPLKSLGEIVYEDKYQIVEKTAKTKP